VLEAFERGGRGGGVGVVVSVAAHLCQLDGGEPVGVDGQQFGRLGCRPAWEVEISGTVTEP